MNHIIRKLEARIQELEDGIRSVVTEQGDDLCWMDVYTKLGKLIGIEFDPKLLPREQMLINCHLFVDSLLDGTKYEPAYSNPEEWERKNEQD